MEALANSTDDFLVDSLSYKLKNGAKYVTDRRSVTYHPSGSNIYKTSSGSKVVKLTLTGDSWLVPDTVKFMMTVRNNAATALRLRTVGGPWSFWRRLRVLCAGQVVEDLDYNRVHEMLQILHSAEARSNDVIEGFGHAYDDERNAGVAASTDNCPGIAGGDTQQVSFKLMSGLFSQKKWLPIRYCPITIELELCNGANDPVITPDDTTAFTTANTSNDWQIEDVQLKCDLCSLDNAVDNQIADHLLSGKSLPINYGTYISQSQTVSGSAISVNVSRAVTRLSSIYMSFEGASIDPRHKPWNQFFHPMSKPNVAVGAEVVPNTTFKLYDPALELEYQVQIGSKLFPEYPVQSLAEAFSQLRKQVKDSHGNDYHGLSISPGQYRQDKHIIGVQTSKLMSAGFTGLNTRSGDLMTLRVKGSGGVTIPAAVQPTTLHVVLHSDQVLEIRDTGVQVFD